MDENSVLREHLVNLLRGKGAHIDFEGIITGFSPDWANRRIEGVPYTPWQLIEHMRIAQFDILEFSRNAKHVSPKWPEGYWPEQNGTGDEEAWNRSIEEFRRDLKGMQSLLNDSATNLYTPIEHGDGQTVLREALLVADHNAYHLGVLATFKRILESRPVD